MTRQTSPPRGQLPSCKQLFSCANGSRKTRSVRRRGAQRARQDTNGEKSRQQNSKSTLFTPALPSLSPVSPANESVTTRLPLFSPLEKPKKNYISRHHSQKKNARAPHPSHMNSLPHTPAAAAASGSPNHALLGLAPTALAASVASLAATGECAAAAARARAASAAAA